jgi:hypothetical protein
LFVCVLVCVCVSLSSPLILFPSPSLCTGNIS